LRKKGLRRAPKAYRIRPLTRSTEIREGKVVPREVRRGGNEYMFREMNEDRSRSS